MKITILIISLFVFSFALRIDSEVSNIHKKLDDMKNQLPLSECEISSEKSYGMSMEVR